MQGAARVWVAVAALLGACATSDLSPGQAPKAARTAPAPSSAAPQPSSSSASAPNTPSAQAELSPEAQELLQRLGPSLSRSSQGLRWVPGPKGTRSLDLQGRFAHATLAVRGADGVVRRLCVENISAAENAARRAEGIAP